MREIKFRAWDTLNKIMVYEMFMFRKAESYDNVQTDYVYYGEFRDYEDGIARPCEIMQFTGLLDKNGREIYEHDVVDSWAGLEDNTKTYLRKVIYRGCGLEFEPMTGYTLCKANEKLFEVIGDIFNNPEIA